MHRQPARDTYHLASDVLGIVARKKRDDAGNVLRPADAFHGDGALESLENPGAVLSGLQKLCQQRRIGGPRANHIQSKHFDE